MRSSIIFRLVCFSFVCGVAAYAFIYSGVEPFFLFSAALGFVAMCIFLRKKQALYIPAVFLVAFLFGMARMALSGAVVEYSGGGGAQEDISVDMQGIVDAEPAVTQSRQMLFLRIKQISGTDHEYTPSHVRVFAALMPSYQYGDELSIRCLLLPQKDTRARIAQAPLCVQSEIRRIAHGKGNWFFAALLYGKEKFLAAIRTHISEPHASLLGALLVGERSGFPSWLIDAFVRSGILHIVAISGYNITIMIVSIYAVLRAFLFGRKQSFLWIVCGIIFFVLLTGSSASVVRAAIMGISVLFASVIGRRSDAGNAILLSASMMALYQPAVLFDIGFQLSFAATCGLVYVSPLLERAFEKMPRMYGVKEIAIQTISATLCTAPLLIYSFERFSVISLIVNILVLPLIPLIMAIGFIWAGFALASGMLNMILPLSFDMLIQIASWPVWFLLSYVMMIAEKFSYISWASVDVRLGAWNWALVYISYAVLTWGMWMRSMILKKRASMIQCEDESVEK